MGKLVLGDFTFAEFEIPDELASLGGQMALRIHRPVGGKRVIDAMGPDYEPIRWRGQFRGPDALARAQALTRMWLSGREFSLTWESYAFTVVIAEYLPRPQSAREVPYSISCEVVRDDAAPPPVAAEVNVDQMVGSDFNAAAELTALLEQAELDERMDALGDAISGVSNLATAPQSALNAILTPLFVAQQTVDSLIATTESALYGVQAVGGVIAGLSGSDLAANLSGQLAASLDTYRLYDVQAYLGRIETNVIAVATAGAAVTTAGADLFTMARDAYGDASEWATIARANGLADPYVAGVADIIVPPTPLGTGGVLP